MEAITIRFWVLHIEEAKDCTDERAHGEEEEAPEVLHARLHVWEHLDDNESKCPVADRHSRLGRRADGGWEHLRNDEPWDWTSAETESEQEDEDNDDWEPRWELLLETVVPAEGVEKIHKCNTAERHDPDNLTAEFLNKEAANKNGNDLCNGRNGRCNTRLKRHTSIVEECCQVSKNRVNTGELLEEHEHHADDKFADPLFGEDNACALAVAAGLVAVGDNRGFWNKPNKNGEADGEGSTNNRVWTP